MPELLGAAEHRRARLAADRPFSVIGLLATVVLLFGFQAEIIIAQPVLIALIAVHRGIKATNIPRYGETNN